MRKNSEFPVIVENLNSGDRKEFSFGKDYRLNHSAIFDRFQASPSSRIVDLLRIAASVYFADRIVKCTLRRRNSEPIWNRRIALTIPVRNIGVWRQATVQSSLRDSVGFVSGDEWRFEFVEDKSSIDVQKPLFERSGLSNSELICLYSGGLDSAAGLAHKLADNPADPISIVVRHRPELAKNVTGQLSRLASHFQTNVHSFVFPMSMHNPVKLVGVEESTQRARSFLFVCCGAAVLSMTNGSNLQVFESGIGAINAPLLASMHGSQATRSAHPLFFKKVSGLLEQVLERDVFIDLPFARFTKGEVVSKMQHPALQEIAKSTVSCVKYPLRKHSGKSCGVCAACLFRRVSFHAAGISESSFRCDVDILNPNSQLRGKKLRPLCAFLNQYDELSTVSSGTLPISITKHLRQTELVGEWADLTQFVELYARYRNEWTQFVSHGRKLGCSWGNMVHLPMAA